MTLLFWSTGIVVQLVKLKKILEVLQRNTRSVIEIILEDFVSCGTPTLGYTGELVHCVGCQKIL